MVLLKECIKARLYIKIHTSFFLSSTVKRVMGMWDVGGRHGQDTPQSRPLLLEKSNFISTFLKAFTVPFIRKFRNNKFHVSKFSHFCISPRK